jgi:O-antigen ligase
MFFAIARAGKSKSDFNEIVASFVLSCCVMSLLAGFESVRSWLLYQYISEAWGQENPLAYLLRDGKLRAQVATGHSLALGYLMALGFGLSLYIRRHIENTRVKKLLPLLIWIGLIGAYSRGPWLVAIIIFVASFAVQPSGLRKASKVILIGAVLFGIVLLTPLGDRIIATLPFVGTIDQENVTYRQQLAELSWRLIKDNPWFGDPFFLDNMEELRQGQGIIDLMNGYAAVALFSGVIGLTFYLGVFVLAAWRTFSTAREFSRLGDEFSYLGYCLVACMLGTFFFIGTAGTGSIYYVLAGMMACYVRIGGMEIAQVWADHSNQMGGPRMNHKASSLGPRAMT